MLGVGRIIINTGDGKGKTTAAFGVALRAAGHGLKTAVVQFLKGTWDYGETHALEALPNIELTRIGSGFTWLADDPALPRSLAEQAWQLANELALSDRYDLLILDELNYAIAEGYVVVEDVLAMLATKPQRLSVVITGRNAPLELIEVADTVTEMRCVKHAFEKGVPARRGIEY
jgi:cob(I)alamin adenosyltransferase